MVTFQSRYLIAAVFSSPIPSEKKEFKLTVVHLFVSIQVATLPGPVLKPLDIELNKSARHRT